MEDQPTDTSDLTEIADATRDDAANAATKAATARPVPVGKRGGRHRYFPPRSAPGTDAPEQQTVVDVTQDTPTATEITDAELATMEASAAEPDSLAVEETTEEVLKPERRRWFRGRSVKTVAKRPTLGETTDTADSETTETVVEEPDLEQAEDETRVPRARKPAGKRMAIAVAVAAALFVAAGAFGGAMLQPYLADRAAAETKLHIARTATDAVTTLFTYTPEDMDQLSARTSKYLGGDLKDAYAKQVDALAPTNKQSQITRSAQVVGAAVESLNGPDATAMVYVNVSYTSAATKDLPKINLVTYRLTMRRNGSDWVITNMGWVTNKDLTRVMP